MDEAYLQRRAEEERRAAEQATDARARRCHERLAALYRDPEVPPPSAGSPVAGNPALSVIILESRPAERPA